MIVGAITLGADEGASLARSDGRAAEESRLSTDCPEPLYFRQTEFASRSSQWFFASRLGRVEMLKGGGIRPGGRS